MLRSGAGAVARRGVASAHRLGSSLDLNDTARWKQRPGSPARDALRGAARPAGGQGPVAGPPRTPLRKPPGRGRRGTTPARPAEPLRPCGPRWAMPAPAPGVGPAHGRSRWKLGSVPRANSPRRRLRQDHRLRKRRRRARVARRPAGANAVAGGAGGAVREPCPLHPERPDLVSARTGGAARGRCPLRCLSEDPALRSPL